MNEVKKTWTYNSWFKLLSKEVFNVYYLKWSESLSIIYDSKRVFNLMN